MKKKSNKKKGQDFEKLVEKTINSGALFFDKGDLKTNDYLIECKTTSKKSFSVTTKILNKLWNNALDSAKLPKLVIGIQTDENMWILNCDVIKKRR